MVSKPLNKLLGSAAKVFSFRSLRRKSDPVRPAHFSPVIGISGYSRNTKSVIAAMQIVTDIGGTPIFLGEHAVRIEGCPKEAALKELDMLCGVVVMGNDQDIDPARYGAERHPETIIEPCEKRAHYEEMLIEECLKQNIPLLCICGGMQRLNVCGGGTLIQHLPDILKHNKHDTRDIDPDTPLFDLHLLEGTRLHELYESMRQTILLAEQAEVNSGIRDNSLHHQAVDKVRDGFIVSAYSEDGVIEAIEPCPKGPYAGQFALGVQWHPEFGASPLSLAILGELIENAKRYTLRLNLHS